MTHKRSSDGYVGVGKQAAADTAVAPSKFTRLSGADSWDFAQDFIEVGSLNADRELDDILKTGHNIDGGFSSYIGVVVAMSVVETKLLYIEADVNEITALSKQTSANHTELVRRGMWIESVEKRLNKLENRKPPI